ncbi:MAG: hypothetical protein ACRBDL_08635 [Alphaproteobacteria bacterium]
MSKKTATNNAIVAGTVASVDFNAKSTEQSAHSTKLANDTPKIVLFAGNNGTGHALLNKLLPEIRSTGLEPVVYLTKGTDSPKAQLQKIADFSFFETGILENIYDFLENSYQLQDKKSKAQKSRFYSPNQLADIHNCQITEIDDLNDPQFIKALATDKAIEGYISLKNYQLFSPETIDVLKGAEQFLWNMHTGELPKYRGVFIPVRVRQENELEYGWSLHEIDTHIDTGPIIDSRTTFLEEDTTILDAYYDMVNKGADMIMDNIKFIVKNTPRPPIPQDHSKARYFSFPTEQDFESLEALNPPVKLYDINNIRERYVNMFSDPENHTQHAMALDAVILSSIEAYNRNATVNNIATRYYVTHPPLDSEQYEHS